jgi:integrase
MASTQGKGNGWFRTRQQTKSEVVYFCHYSEDPATGARKEKLHKLGPVSQFPDEASRWQEVGRLGLTSFIDNPISEITFEGLVKLYIDSGAIGQKTLSQKKASGTVAVIRHNLETHCMPRWRNTPAGKIQPESVEEWLLSLHQEKKLAWTTINKVKHAMRGVFKFGRKKKFLPADFDPFQDIDCEASSDYEAITCSPEQTLAILNQLDEPEFILTLLIAATGLSISEALGLQWADVEYARKRIVIRRSWVEEIGNCKNIHRKAPVALHPVLGDYLRHWQSETMYTKPTDWVFASTKLKGAKPRCGSIASQTYLYPTAVKAGVFEAVEERSQKGELIRLRYLDPSGRPVKRWGFHNLRHSLGSWLVANGVDLKTVSSMLRHSNVRTTLGIYSHAVDANKLAAQGQYLNTLLSSETVQ